MKIAIFSDSHGSVQQVNQVFTSGADAYFFLGDGLSDLGSNLFLPNVYAVKGNCDFLTSADVPGEKIIDLDGVRFLLVHGHNENVKRSFLTLIKRAKQIGAGVVCFGHTHQFFYETEQGITLLNPGSLSLVRGGSACFVMLEIENGKYSLQRVFF